MATSLHRDPSAPPTEFVEASRPAVNWGSALAGAAVALGSTLILVALGTGLGLAAASPWPGAGATATTFAVGLGIWLIVTQWLSSFLGGYIAGRLRTRWTNIHTNEVLFRDTAHGLLAWAVATTIVGGVALSATSSAAGAASSAAATSVGYAADTMLRSTRPGSNGVGLVPADVARLLGRGADLQADDRAYLANEVAARTGVTPQEAQQRVAAAETSIREAADKARKASSALGFFTALSMLIGAFIASVAAAYGGHLRDQHGDAERV